MSCIVRSPHFGHSSPVFGPNFASRAATRACSVSTSVGNWLSRFQAGIRSNVFITSSSSPMVSPFVKVSGCDSSDSMATGLATQHPWKPDPNDDRTPIAPPDTVDSVSYTEALQRVCGIFCVQILLKLQAAVDRAQQIVAHVLAAGHASADRSGFAQQLFSLRHRISFGWSGQGGHSGFLHRVFSSRSHHIFLPDGGLYDAFRRSVFFSEVVVMATNISLTKGHTTIVDDSDAQAVQAHRWYASVRPSGAVYAQGQMKTPQGWKGMSLHRMIMCAQPGQIVDHINGDTLDNRRANLRFVTPQQNAFNKKPSSKFGFSGVRRSGQSWSALISINGIDIPLGSYETKEDAAAAYNAASTALHGEYARLNDVRTPAGLLEEIIQKKKESICRIAKEIAILRGLS